jgi:hypothetical protein
MNACWILTVLWADLIFNHLLQYKTPVRMVEGVNSSMIYLLELLPMPQYTSLPLQQNKTKQNRTTPKTPVLIGK